MTGRLAVGVDVGGTKISAGVVSETGELLARAQADTAPASVLDSVCALVGELRRAHPAVATVGVGFAGFLDATREQVLFAPNVALGAAPLRALLAARLAAPVTVENDANAAAWGEHRFGAGRGERDLVMVTVGTGMGGAAVLNGRLYRGGFGIAGEFGHMRVVPDGLPCGCGNRGCWEQYCSGRALARAAARHGVAAVGGPALTALAHSGDRGALACFAEVGEWLGQGLADLAAAFDPALFVVGGGVSEAGELLLEPARRAFAGALTGRGHRPLAGIRGAELGADAGLVGAAELARSSGSGGSGGSCG